MILKNFFCNKSGATAIEYGLIVGLIAVVLITAVTTVGNKNKRSHSPSTVPAAESMPALKQ